MQAMATIDFDKLAAMPDKIDALIREQRVTNVLLTRIINPTNGSDAAEMLLMVEKIVEGRHG